MPRPGPQPYLTVGKEPLHDFDVQPPDCEAAVRLPAWDARWHQVPPGRSQPCNSTKFTRALCIVVC
jgi:hypothetical protein